MYCAVWTGCAVAIVLACIVAVLRRATAIRSQIVSPGICRRLEEWFPAVRAELARLPRHMITEAHRGRSEWGDAKNASVLLELHREKTGWVYAWKNDTEPNRDWLNFGLVFDKRPIGRNATLCPMTMECLRGIPGLQVAGFSLLMPGGKIDEHTDSLDPRSRTFHLGVDVPSSGASLHVRSRGGRLRRIGHANGASIWFDSRYPHWVVNESPAERTVLYLDVRV